MSKFVPGGTIDKPLERDDEWRKAQEQIEAAHLRKLKEGQQEGGKSLYEVLQANKAAKQDAFEESIRLKNQFRSLDEDEVTFLDKVLESTRAKEAAVRKETTEQLELFRRQQEETGKHKSATADSGISPVAEEQWVTGRKRKKGKDSEGFIKGLKLRKTSSTERDHAVTSPTDAPPQNTTYEKQTVQNTVAPVITDPEVTQGAAVEQIEVEAQKPTPQKLPGLGLADYSSDED